ncbi:MAG: hypothetical protein WCH13_15500 [Deltaproteobacteria bacterium]
MHFLHLELKPLLLALEDRLRRAGVTRLHVAFASRSCDELLGQIEAFASGVMVIL